MRRPALQTVLRTHQRLSRKGGDSGCSCDTACTADEALPSERHTRSKASPPRIGCKSSLDVNPSFGELFNGRCCHWLPVESPVVSISKELTQDQCLTSLDRLLVRAGHLIKLRPDVVPPLRRCLVEAIGDVLVSDTHHYARTRPPRLSLYVDVPQQHSVRYETARGLVYLRPRTDR